VDLPIASSALVLARAQRLNRSCAAAGRATKALAALLAAGAFDARARAAQTRARHDLAGLASVLAKCERDYDVAAPKANADTLKAWGPFRLARLDLDLRRYAPGVRDFQDQTGIR
jgi:hypothetical protein